MFLEIDRTQVPLFYFIKFLTDLIINNIDTPRQLLITIKCERPVILFYKKVQNTVPSLMKIVNFELFMKFHEVSSEVTRSIFQIVVFRDM